MSFGVTYKPVTTPKTKNRWSIEVHPSSTETTVEDIILHYSSSSRWSQSPLAWKPLATLLSSLSCISLFSYSEWPSCIPPFLSTQSSTIPCSVEIEVTLNQVVARLSCYTTIAHEQEYSDIRGKLRNRLWWRPTFRSESLSLVDW